MMKVVFILGSVLLSCSSVKTKQPEEKKDTVVQVSALKDSIPVCIRAKIDSFNKAKSGEHFERVDEYQYKGKKVYYIVSPCCDFYNVVYDDKCRIIGYPDGGFTGRGDGSMQDFFKEATNKKQIWVDKKE